MLKERMKALNFLKGISAIIIAYFYHYRNDFAINIGKNYPYENLQGIFGGIKWWSIKGWMLTDLFFVLSGMTFVIAYKNKIALGKISFHDFMLNRVKRLFPMMVISTITMTIMEYIYYICSGGVWWLSEANIWNVFISIIGMPTGWFNMGCIINMPIWYISILFQCYIIAYIFVRIINRCKCSNWLWCIPIIFYLSVEYSALANSNFLLINQFTARGIKAFFIGIVLTVLLEKYEAWIVKNLKPILIGVYSVLLLIYALFKAFGEGIFGNVLYVFVFIIFPCVIFLFLYSNFWNRLACFRGFQFLGKVSFEMYLWNLPIQLATFLLSDFLSYEFPYENAWFLIAHMIISIIISSIIYYLVEKPIQNKLTVKRNLQM